MLQVVILVFLGGFPLVLRVTGFLLMGTVGAAFLLCCFLTVKNIILKRSLLKGYLALHKLVSIKKEDRVSIFGFVTNRYTILDNIL